MERGPRNRYTMRAGLAVPPIPHMHSSSYDLGMTSLNAVQHRHNALILLRSVTA